MQSIVFITIESLGFGAAGIFTSQSAAELLEIVNSLSQIDQLFTNRTYLASGGQAAAATAVRILITMHACIHVVYHIRAM